MTVAAGRSSLISAARITLSGLVQGVGMRPTVARLAQKLKLSGSVRNDESGVEIHVEGPKQCVEQFCDQLPAHLPSSAVVDEIQSRACVPQDVNGFVIEDSRGTDLLSTLVPTDIALCADCHSDVRDAQNRRHRDPFATCVNCGPRYSLVEAMPFDRISTSMQDFRLCPDCEREYHSPSDRRCHSQTTACPVCGPQLTFEDPAAAMTCSGFEAIQAAARAVRRGRIAAVKGIGGFQLVCDATSTEAVNRLRERKRRPQKPFAVMVEHFHRVGTACHHVPRSGGQCPPCDEETDAVGRNPSAEAALQSRQNPIVLLPKDSGPMLQGLSEAIHPGLKHVGVMLPTSSLHLLLLKEAGRPCVVTSGNAPGEPLVFQNECANHSLRDLADVWLTHNRKIIRPIDDSVVKIIRKGPVTIRAARGIAPVPLDIPTNRSILAVGGHQKVALALSSGTQSVLGPHIGDMSSIAVRQRFIAQVDRLCQLFETVPAVIAHDLHPDFFTTRWACEQNVPTVAVQHHHAHVVAGMIEHRLLDSEVLGVAFDGSGYGTDGTVQGGEFLLCTAASFQRAARLKPFPLPGGDLAVREPWRIAAALLHAAGINRMPVSIAGAGSVPEKAWNAVGQLLRHGSNRRAPFPDTSSVGRLFDGVACLLLGISEVSFEGEAAMRLESECDTTAVGQYVLPIDEGNPAEMNWKPMIRKIVDDMQKKIPVQTIAMRFIRSLAAAVGAVCSGFPNHPVILSGGCFQNAVLTEETARVLQGHPKPVCLPGLIPPNDGGLAAGQLAVAAARLTQTHKTIDSARGVC